MEADLLVLPRWQCHKVVRAAKIVVVREMNRDGAKLYLDVGVGMMGAEGTDVSVTSDWVTKHRPCPSGYFVVYDDGYQSFSPAEAFEEGYTRIEA